MEVSFAQKVDDRKHTVLHYASTALLISYFAEMGAKVKSMEASFAQKLVQRDESHRSMLRTAREQWQASEKRSREKWQKVRITYKICDQPLPSFILFRRKLLMQNLVRSREVAEVLRMCTIREKPTPLLYCSTGNFWCKRASEKWQKVLRMCTTCQQSFQRFDAVESLLHKELYDFSFSIVKPRSFHFTDRFSECKSPTGIMLRRFSRALWRGV